MKDCLNFWGTKFLSGKNRYSEQKEKWGRFMSCKDKDYYKCDDCVDAWKLSMMYGCNESPNVVTDLEREVEIGDCVEINRYYERIWIQVTDVCVCFVVGTVIGPLHSPHPFNVGDKIKIEAKHIYNVDKGCEDHSI
jgi:hypothetical protein